MNETGGVVAQMESYLWELYDKDPIYKHPLNFSIFFTAWFIMETLGNFLLVSMIITLRDNQYVTLPNKLTCFYYETVIVISNLVIVNIEFLRLIFGPLPENLCLLSNFCLRVSAMVISLTNLQVFGLKWLYVTIWKNVGILNDEFFECFFKLANIGLSMFYGSLVVYSGGYVDYHYLSCIQGRPHSRDLPSEFLVSPRISMRMISLSVMVSLIISVLIWRKRKQPTSSWSRHNQVAAQEGLACSFLVGVAFFSVALPAVGVLWATKLEDYTTFPYSTLFIITKILFPIFPSIIMPLMIISGNPKYWKSLKMLGLLRKN